MGKLRLVSSHIIMFKGINLSEYSSKNFPDRKLCLLLFKINPIKRLTLRLIRNSIQGAFIMTDEKASNTNSEHDAGIIYYNTNIIDKDAIRDIIIESDNYHSLLNSSLNLNNENSIIFYNFLKNK